MVAEGLEASGLDPGGAAGDPLVALRRAGDPVLAVAAGVAAAACLRHKGFDAPLSLSTTGFVDADPSVDLEGAAAELDLAVTVTDPGFDDDHPALAAYERGEAKEGVGMGGALALADRAHLPMADVRDGVRAVYDRLLADADREVPER